MELIKILHILHSMDRGGAENSLMNYYRHIDRNVVQFDFLLTKPEKSVFEDEITQLGGRVYHVPMLRKNNPFPYLLGLFSFFKKHKEYRIIHSHTSSKSAIPLAIGRFCGIPVRCCHSHSSQTDNGINGLIRKMLMPFLKITATDFLACGEQAAVWLYGRSFFQEGKVMIFKNVIEAKKFQYNSLSRKKYREKYGIDDETILLGHTARFNSVKNHLFDIDILSSIKNQGKKVKLLLLGGGELEDEIRQKAVSSGVAEDVIFAGVVSNVYDYEQAMDIFLLPSFYEGLPLSIIEAQVSGLPCFTTLGAVSKECSVTDLVTYLKLEDGAEKWADIILNKVSQMRKDRSVEIANAGYDAGTSATLLQDFYIKRYNDSLKNN